MMGAEAIAKVLHFLRQQQQSSDKIWAELVKGEVGQQAANIEQRMWLEELANEQGV